MQDVFSDMAAKCPSAIIARSEIHAFTGGLIKGSYVANLDAKGEGPPKVRMNQKWAYPVADFVNWLRHRSQAGGKY
jgi:hypothetical protein